MEFIDRFLITVLAIVTIIFGLLTFTVIGLAIYSVKYGFATLIIFFSVAVLITWVWGKYDR